MSVWVVLLTVIITKVIIVLSCGIECQVERLPFNFQNDSWWGYIVYLNLLLHSSRFGSTWNSHTLNEMLFQKFQKKSIRIPLPDRWFWLVSQYLTKSPMCYNNDKGGQKFVRSHTVLLLSQLVKDKQLRTGRVRILEVRNLTTTKDDQIEFWLMISSRHLEFQLGIEIDQSSQFQMPNAKNEIYNIFPNEAKSFFLKLDNQAI